MNNKFSLPVEGDVHGSLARGVPTFYKCPPRRRLRPRRLMENETWMPPRIR